ncbi:MAG: extracellular solute-binding protein [Acetobacteraceae bacterium]
MPTDTRLTRRRALASSAAGLAAPFLTPGIGRAAEALNFSTWSAAVDQVKAHLAGFEKQSGIPVAYTNAPFAQYRETMITRFTGGAPVDVLWVSDSWLPEFAEAGWIEPVDQFPKLMAYDAETSDFCNKSMTYKGKQYGLTYYTDYMSFLYDAEMLAKAGIAAPPATWTEVTEQAKAIKAKGLSEYPVAIGLAQESWLIEFMTAMVLSHGGRFVDDSGQAAPSPGTEAALQWLIDAVQTHKIMSPGAVQTGELEILKSVSAGRHAFALLPKHRLRVVNDKSQSQVAGHIRQALMPAGQGGSHATVGWMRFYGMTARAAASKERAANAAKLIEWFGGKADGAYRFQKVVTQELGLGFGAKPLFNDPEIRRVFNEYGDVDLMAQQQELAQKKDTIAPWFGEWNDLNGAEWQQAVLGKKRAADAIKAAAAKWDELKKQG